MSRLDLDQLDRDAAAARLRDRDHHREPGARRPRGDNRDLNPRRAFQAGVIDLSNRAHASTTIEVPCPLCLSTVYTLGDSDRERIDCLDCGAALLTKRGIDGVATLELDTTDDRDTLVPDAPPPPLGAGRHLSVFDAGGEPVPGDPFPDLFPPGGWRRRVAAAINQGMAPRSNRK